MMRLIFIFLLLAALAGGVYFYRDQIPIPANLFANQTGGGATQAAPPPGIAASARDLKLCNETSSRIGVAIGYKDVKEGWTSEGWWNIASKSCDVLIQDRLRARYYYIYAIDYDRGGEWAGPIPMCTDDSEFTIRGLENCESRGYKRTGFFEIDTQEQTGWTVKLTEQSEATSANTSAGALTR